MAALCIADGWSGFGTCIVATLVERARYHSAFNLDQHPCGSLQRPELFAARGRETGASHQLTMGSRARLGPEAWS